MINRKSFFDTIRRTLFDGKLTAGQTAGIVSILDEWEAHHADKDLRWLSYILATVHHETDRTMAPIEEYGKGKGRKYGGHVMMSGKAYTSDLPLYYGRGHVMLTWYENYEKFGRLLHLDLLHHPELVLTMPVSIKILFIGMMDGLFTGKRLSDFLDSTESDWINARRIINSTDKATLIADYAMRYCAALRG